MADLAQQAGWLTEAIIADYAGIERVVVLRPAGKESEAEKQQR